MSIVELSKIHVKEAFDETDIELLSYHNWKHTLNVFNAAQLIAENTKGVSEQDKEHLKIACLFHDIGYIKSPKNHEERSAEMAEKFLNANNYNPEGIAAIKKLILATQLGRKPESKTEEIIADADLSHLGREDYVSTTYLFLSKELSKYSECDMSRKDWALSCATFLNSHSYYTDYANKLYKETKLKNLEKVKELAKQENKEKEEQKEKDKNDKDKETSNEKKKEKKKKKKKKKDEKVTPAKQGQSNPLKGVETMFKIALRNHVDLSAIADKKANTLISVNAIIISIVLSALFPKLDSNPFLFWPSVTILTACFITVILSILSTIPNVTRGMIDKSEVEEQKGNLIFFGNFHKMKISDYEWSMHQLMEQKDYLYDTMTRDLFYLGIVLNKKYTLLRYAYFLFMAGLLASIIVFIYNMFPYIGSTTSINFEGVNLIK